MPAEPISYSMLHGGVRPTHGQLSELISTLRTEPTFISPPTAAFNEADMILRRDLKLNYLAGLVSLTIDKDSTILDRAALDIASYAKPVSIVSGPQGTPSLQQIKEMCLERRKRTIE
jgi:hypothetical protein